MTTRAYGKINLGLRILRKRSDGYHDIETVFHQIDVFDELSFRLHESDVLLTSTDPQLPVNNTNLCVKAAHLLRDLTGVQEGVEITLKKNIPMGAGLGGGSADAAATLLTLTRLWNLELNSKELHTLAANLGSDVPFFLVGNTAYATSRGEQLEPMILRFPYWIVLVTLPVHVSTAWAYKMLRRDDHPVPPAGFKSVLLEHALDHQLLSRTLTNDFEQVVFEGHPELREIKEAMINEGADVALLSGSGSSVFALTKSEAIAGRLASRFDQAGRVFLTKPFFSTTNS
ncbi:MAG: 4-(cytidine 5'-diphospho)-2-C-methyl-D-erythritol kinase [Bacteroidota bacterium]